MVLYWNVNALDHIFMRKHIPVSYHGMKILKLNRGERGIDRKTNRYDVCSKWKKLWESVKVGHFYTHCFGRIVLLLLYNTCSHECVKKESLSVITYYWFVKYIVRQNR